MLNTLFTAWNWTERHLVGLLTIFALAVASYQIAGRYLPLGLPISWSNETIIYLLAWATLISGSLLVHEDGHVRADLVLQGMPAKYQRSMEIFNTAVALVFCLVLTYYGILATTSSWGMDERSVGALRFPMWIYYAALPTSMALMTLRYARRLYCYLFRYDPGTMSVKTGHES